MKKTLLLSIAVFVSITGIVSADTFGTAANQFDIDFVSISSDTNPTSGDGIVNNDYRIGTYEITNDQFAKFRNEYGTVTGTPSGAYDEAPYYTGTNVPTNNLSWYEGAQFVNWLNTSTGHSPAYKFTGTQGQSDYTFTVWDVTDIGYNPSNRYRNSNSHYFLPTEDEWVKAAYWNGTNLQTYATKSGETLFQGNGSNGGWNYDDGDIGPDGPGESPWNVGSGSVELNGTYDMMGNVWEWTERLYHVPKAEHSDMFCYMSGGSFDYTFSSGSRLIPDPASDRNSFGFRVASVVPEPQTLTVCPDGSCDYPTIQDAIDAAYDGDTVTVMPGTYVENLNLFRKPITLTSTYPNDPAVVAATIIDGNQAGTVIYDAGTDTLIAGLTITNGGYGMDNAGGGNSPTVTNCTFRDNATGMDNVACSPTVTNCTFRDNGCGMSNGYGGNPTVTNCPFRDNAQGMDNYRSSPKMTNCIFTGNTSGGMTNFVHSSPTVTDCIFTGNTAGSGGGMRNEVHSSPTVTNCIFTGNTASFGGGMYDYWHCNPTVTNCTFAGNSAEQGVILYTSHGGDVSLTNSILWGNTMLQDGSDIYLSPGEGRSLDVNHCDVQGGANSVFIEDGGILNWGTGNIDTDPLFADPGFWDANGTPADANDDIWIDGDYHLQSLGWRWEPETSEWVFDRVTSPCIDAGNPGASLADELITIPDDPANEWGENIRINMGAYGGTAEASMPPYDWVLLADMTNDGKVDAADLSIQSNDWLNADSEQPGDLDRDGIIALTDFVLLAEDWLNETSWH